MDAKVAWSQISNGAKMQVGARGIVGSEDQLAFEVLKRKGSKMFKVSISLEDDLYNIKLMQIDTRTYEVDVLEEYTGIYAEELSRALISICDTLQKRKRNTEEEDDGYAHQYYDENPNKDKVDKDTKMRLIRADTLIDRAISNLTGFGPRLPISPVTHRYDYEKLKENLDPLRHYLLTLLSDASDRVTRAIRYLKHVRQVEKKT